jgi:NDP-sugar pyrophosphorylase family protein
MKAVVLAAGLGTRLGELTADRAKPALEVGGRPIVAHVVAHLAARGFDAVAVNLHQWPEQVRAALADAWPAIAWFEEDELLGTAGALTAMRGFLADADAFLVHYGDILTDHDLGGLLERHRASGALLTMLVHARPGSNSVVTLDDDDRVVGFLERPTEAERAGADSPWVNSGIYACSRAVLELVPGRPSDMARDVVPSALARGVVRAERLRGYRCAIDAPARLAEAERAIAAGEWRSSLVSTPRPKS